MKLTKIKQFLGLFLVIFLGFSGTVTLVLPHHALAANFILGDGSPGSISNGDNTQFVFVDPFTIRGPGGTLYTTASDACDNDNMFLCSGSGETFHSHNYWYWPQGTNISDSGFFPATNGQCVSALVLGIPVSGKGLRNAHLSVVNSENSAGGCHVLDNSKKTIAGKDILGWGAWARDDENVGDTYNNTDGNGTPQVLSSDVAAADISKSNTSDKSMYLALGTVFKWVNSGEIDSIPNGVQSTAATDTSTAAYKDIVSGLQQSSGSTKNYAGSDYTYFFPNACIDSGSGKIKAFIAVNKSDTSQLTILHRIDGDTSKAFVNDWYGDQSSCLWGGNNLKRSPSRVWSDSNQSDGTIGIGDLTNAAQASTATGGGGSPQAGTSDSKDALDCGAGALDWIVCSVINTAQSAANTLDSFITSMLNVDASGIFEKGTAKDGYYTAWNSFRILATALIVIAGLVMVTSQALGFEALDAYTVRKTLPRLLVAIIGISLSWPLMDFVTKFFDVLGHDIGNLMYTPFNHLASNVGVQAGLASILGVGAVVLAMGFASLTFILTGLLAMFVAFLTLVIRQVAIIILVILAPVAIACYILPGTQKAWQLWRENFLGLLMMFPLIVVFIAAGHIFSAVSLSAGAGGTPQSTVTQLIGVLGYFIPYFLLPMAFRMATGAVANIAGMVNDANKGAFDRLKGARSNAMQRRAQEFRSGSLLGGDKIGLNALGRHYNAGIRGHYGMGSRGRQLLSTDASVQAEQALKNNPRLSKFAQGNDEGNAVLALSGGTRAGAEAAARQLFRRTNERGEDVYDEEKGREAIEAAAGIGFNRQNAAAALIGLGQNKSRAVGAGRADIVRDGIDRLAGNNEAMAQEMTGTFAFMSRQAGRADLGGMSWAARGKARTDFNTQVAELARNYAGGGPVTQAHKDQAFRDMAMSEGIGRTKVDDVVTGHTSGMQQAVDLSLRMLEHGSAPQRQLAATRLLEYQQSLSRASGDNQTIINDALQRAGVSYDGAKPDGTPMGSVADQLAELASMDVNALTRGARTYGADVPVGARVDQAAAQAAQQQQHDEEG